MGYWALAANGEPCISDWSVTLRGCPWLKLMPSKLLPILGGFLPSAAVSDGASICAPICTTLYFTAWRIRVFLVGSGTKTSLRKNFMIAPFLWRVRGRWCLLYPMAYALKNYFPQHSLTFAGVVWMLLEIVFPAWFTAKVPQLASANGVSGAAVTV